MAVSDAVNYVVFTNPLSKAVIGTTSRVLKFGATVNGSANASCKCAPAAMPPLWKLAGGHYHFVRLAGISSASAVLLAAFGNHVLSEKGDQKAVFENANRLHFIHSLALMSVPLVRRPIVTALLMITGTVLFSGTLYYRALTNDKKFNKFAPYGATILMLAWLSVVF